MGWGEGWGGVGERNPPVQCRSSAPRRHARQIRGRGEGLCAAYEQCDDDDCGIHRPGPQRWSSADGVKRLVTGQNRTAVAVRLHSAREDRNHGPKAGQYLPNIRQTIPLASCWAGSDSCRR